MSVDKAVGAGAWSALDIVLRQGVQFFVSVILARLLAPADFGLIALLTFFTSLSITFVQGGLSMALVQRQETTRAEETAVFWCNLAASIAFGIILIAIAPAVARFYAQPLLGPLMYVAVGQVVLSALGAVQTALLTRTLRFDQLTKTGIFSSLLSGVAGVAAAVAGWGVWALAVQLLTAAAAGAASLWWVSDWRPAWRVDPRSISGLLGFGVRISLSSILDVVYTNGVLLVIGKAYGVAELGLWNRATGVTSLPTGIIGQIIGRTALPLFAERASEPQALRRGFRMAIGLSMLLSLPLMVGLSLLSDIVVVALFGPKWLAAAPLMAITALSGMLLPLQILNVNLLLALGDSRTFLRIEVWKKILGVLIVGTGCFFGTIGVAWSALAISIVAYAINARPIGAAIGYGIVRQVADIRRIILAALVMAAGVYALKLNLSLSPWPKLAILMAAGGLIYLAAGMLFRVPQLLEALDLGKLLASKALRRSRQEAPDIAG